jgi:hypothetical protein
VQEEVPVSRDEDSNENSAEKSDEDSSGRLRRWSCESISD